MAGARCALLEIEQHLNNLTSHLLVAIEQGDVIACICLAIQQDSAYIGLFSVDPKRQGLGVGKMVLSLAEDYAQQTLKVNKCSMVVISQRTELIDFYIRQGYRLTGLIEAYPLHLNVGSPLQADLRVETLEKQFSSLEG